MKALREIERKDRLVGILREGLGASESELKTMFDPVSAPAKGEYAYGGAEVEASDSVARVAEH